MVDVETILRQGDFELGTFAGLDGEMVVLDGAVYKVCGTGQVSRGVRLAAHSVRYAEEQTVLRINDGLGGGANRGE
jgi:alpha-acetolactate decarboxylase